MTSVPFGTLSGTSSMVRLMSSSGITSPSPFPASGHHDGLLASRDVILELVAELLDPRHDGRGAGVAQHANRLPGHVVRQVEQQIEVGHLPLPHEDPLEDLGGPRRSLAALRALRARPVRVEAAYPPDLVFHVRDV